MKTNRDDLVAAIMEFETALPDWWWSIGYCGVSRDADCKPMCGPDYSVIDDDIALKKLELNAFDNGFTIDDVAPDSTVASSLRNVMRQALAAIAELKNDPEAARRRYISTLIKQRDFSEERATAQADEIGLKAKK